MAMKKRGDSCPALEPQRLAKCAKVADMARETLPRRLPLADPNTDQVTGTADDIDHLDMSDPLCVTTYVQDMYKYFKEKELTTSVNSTYMETQPFSSTGSLKSMTSSSSSLRPSI